MRLKTELKKSLQYYFIFWTAVTRVAKFKFKMPRHSISEIMLGLLLVYIIIIIIIIIIMLDADVLHMMVLMLTMLI
jgi:hypothetical protein